MKFTIIAVALGLSATVSGQLIPGLPQCALTCFTQSMGLASSCSGIDFRCFCSTSAFIQAMATCIASTCDASEQASALRVATSLCQQAGVTIPTTFPVAPTTTAAELSTEAPPPATSSSEEPALTSSTEEPAVTSSAEEPTLTSSTEVPVAVSSTGVPAASSTPQKPSSPTTAPPAPVHPGHSTLVTCVTGTGTGTRYPAPTGNVTVPVVSKPSVALSEGAAGRVGVSLSALGIAVVGFFML